jgi:NTE family protein
MDDTSIYFTSAQARAHVPSFEGWRPDRCGRVALVLQGGGALGAYQAGVYQALHEAGIEPDFVSGVSIGAINAAIIAGNSPAQRLNKLRAFWEMITDRKIWPFAQRDQLLGDDADGAAGFFRPACP